MNEIGQFSMLAMVTAAVVYLFAVFAHAAEWAAARNAEAPVRRRRRQSALVGAGAPVEEELPEPPASAETDGDRLKTDKFGRIGIAFTMIAFAAHLIGVVTRGIAGQRLPWGNMYEFTTSSMAFVVLCYLVLALKFNMRWLGLLMSLSATIMLGLAVTVFYVDVAPLVPALHSAWFLFHILAATLSGAAFTIGGVASVLYLLKSRAEQRDVVRGYLAKLPSSARIDRLAYVVNAFAFPLFTFVIAAGAIWAQYAWGRYWGWDPKETWSLVTWAVYAAYLHARVTAGWKGKKAAIIAIIGMVSFWWNFVGVNLVFSGLHSYAR